MDTIHIYVLPQDLVPEWRRKISSQQVHSMGPVEGVIEELEHRDCIPLSFTESLSKAQLVVVDKDVYRTSDFV